MARPQPSRDDEQRAHQLRRHAHAVRDFMSRYERAVMSGDGGQLSALWALPAGVFDAAGVTSIESIGDVEQILVTAKQQHAALGIVDSRLEILDENWVGDRIVIAKVQWQYFDGSGGAIGSEDCNFTLRRGDSGDLEIRAVLVHGILRN
ncbi:MAG: hypothetical protein H6Q90_3899 [Deltaproteobacteria bacterium]|nr:hypothetical protein [Deltaproteobacteria bacterium]